MDILQSELLYQTAKEFTKICDFFQRERERERKKGRKREKEREKERERKRGRKREKREIKTTEGTLKKKVNQKQKE